jgi:thioredoxin 1
MVNIASDRGMALLTRCLAPMVVALGLTLTACGSSENGGAAPADQPAVQESIAQPDPAPEAAESADPAAQAPGSYITFAEYEANASQFDETNVVLFFNAAWCSTCQKARDNIEADLAAIPSDLTIVVVDYDAAEDLKRKYGVTLQHTFVQIDESGNELAKWSGSVTADQIAQNTV